MTPREDMRAANSGSQLDKEQLLISVIMTYYGNS